MTTEERLEALDKELTRAKRRNRWSLTGTALVLVVGIVLCVKAFGPRKAQTAGGAVKEVRASSFTLVNQDGMTRACLRITEAGPTLAFYDVQGKVRIGLALTEAGPVLGLSDAQGTARVKLAQIEAGPGLGVCDAQGTARIALCVTPFGPVLALYDAQEKPIWSEP